MRKAYLAPILILISSFAFATGHCGQDPTKPSTTPSNCITQPFSLQVLNCTGMCDNYNRAASAIMAAKMNGRHGHGPHTWTAFMEWSVPDELKDTQVVISVAPGLDVFQNGHKLPADRSGNYTINFHWGFLVLMPNSTKEGQSLEQPN